MKRRVGDISQRTKTSTLLGIVVVVVLLAVGAVLVMQHNNKDADLKLKPASSPTPRLQGPAKIGSAPAGPEAPGALPSSTPTVTQNPSHPESQTLAAPIGPNDNVGTVSLSGATGMESTCQSVPGASCYIQASMNGTVKQVGVAQTIPDRGSDGVILNWNANQLTVGTWQVHAIAIFNGQTAISAPQSLTVTK